MPEVLEAQQMITFDVPGGEYRHWKLTIDGRIATVAMDVNAASPNRCSARGMRVRGTPSTCVASEASTSTAKLCSWWRRRGWWQ